MRSLSTGAVEDPYSARFHLCRSGRHPDGAQPVEGLRMSQGFAHTPVMVDDVVSLFGPVPAGLVIDATVGGGGHAAALLRAYPHLELLGIDRDAEAVAAAGAALAPFGDRARVVHARFDRLTELVAEVLASRDEPASGILFDLGVSSPQLDRAERGFSYRADAPLDMRMDRSQPLTAASVVNTWPEDELVELLAANGEGRFAGRIVKAMVAARPVLSTMQLVDVVRAAIPAAARRTGGHPAKRVFQALRLAVNDELALLGPSLDQALSLLAPGGRCVVLAYHSGEDRIVKDRFRSAATGGCSCPPGLPCVCGAQPSVRLVFRGARRPSPAEVSANPRAESARLRAVERVTPRASTNGEPRSATLVGTMPSPTVPRAVSRAVSAAAIAALAAEVAAASEGEAAAEAKALRGKAA
jgi:16S rRNA (cytosine1402-N4)-methyltransferase